MESFRASASDMGEGVEYAPSDDGDLSQQLAQKVRQQAQRLAALEQYRLLCEHRLLELAPDHPLPVLPEHIGRLQVDRARVDMHQAHQRIARLEQQLETTGAFNPDFHALQREKADLEASLRAETLRTEEQRAYIEALKQALEAKMETQGYTGSLDAFEDLTRTQTHLSRLQKDHSKCQFSLLSLQEQLATRTAEASEAQDRAQRLSEELREVTAALQQDVQELGKLEEEKAALLDYVHEHAETHEDLSEANARLEKEAKLGKAEISRLERELETAEKRLKDLKNSHFEAISSKEELSVAHSSLFSQLDTTQTRLQSTESRLFSLESQLKAASEGLKAATSRNEQLQANYSTLSASLQETQTELDRAQSAYQGQLVELKEDKSALIQANTRRKDLEMANKRLESDLKAVTEQAEAADQRLSFLDQESQERLQQSHSRQEATVRENLTLKQRLREIEKELEARGEDTLLQSAAFQGENRELRSTIESLRVQMGEIAKEKQEIEAKASEYRVKTEESGFKSLQTEIKRLGQTSTSLQRRCDLLSDENSVLRSQLAQTEAKNREIASDLRENQRKLAETVSENESLRVSLDTVQADLDRISSDTQTMAEEAFRTRQNSHKAAQTLLEREEEMEVLWKLVERASAAIGEFAGNFGAVCLASGQYSAVVSEAMRGALERWGAFAGPSRGAKGLAGAVEDWVSVSLGELEALVRRVVELKAEVAATSQRFSHSDRHQKDWESLEKDSKARESALSHDLTAALSHHSLLQRETQDCTQRLTAALQELASTQLESARLSSEVMRLQSQLEVFSSPTLRWQAPAAEPDDLFIQRAMESKMALLVKAKQGLETLLVRVGNAVRAPELRRVIEDWMKVRGELEVGERDRLRLCGLLGTKEKEAKMPGLGENRREVEALKDQLSRSDGQIALLKRKMSQLDGELADLERSAHSQEAETPLKSLVAEELREGPPPPPSMRIESRVVRLASKEARPRLTIQDKLEQARAELSHLRKRPLA